MHGNWGTWTSWTSCGVTCGSGTQTRNRYCNSPAPAYGGLQCFGTNVETQNCNTYVNCPGKIAIHLNTGLYFIGSPVKLNEAK